MCDGCGQAHLCDWLWSWLQQRWCACLRLYLRLYLCVRLRLCLRLRLRLAAGLYRCVRGGQYGAGGRLWDGPYGGHRSATHLILEEIREIHLITDELQHLCQTQTHIIL